MRRLIALFKNIDSDASDGRRDDRFQCRQISETSPFAVESLETRMLLSADIGIAAALVEQFEPTPEPPIVLDWSDSGETDEGDAHDGAPGEMEEEEEDEGGDFIDHESFDELYGEFEFDEFLELEKDGPLGGQGGSVEELPEPADALVNNNAGASGTVGFTQSETSVIAFGNTVLVAFNDSGSTTGGTNKFTGFSRSTDGGVTFTDGGTLPTNAGGDAGDPVLARNNTSGRIYFSTLGSSSVSTIQVFRSDDGGATWMDPVNGTPGGNSEDKEWVTVDNFAGSGNGNVYLVSRRFSPTAQGIYFFRSTDNGDTFGPTGGTLMVPVSQGAFVAVGPDHSVYVFWWAGTSIQMRKSTDQGLTFGASVTVASGLSGGELGLTGIRQGTATPSLHRSNEFPHAAINPVNGNIYVAYNNDGPGADRADVFVVQSTTGGATWGAPIKVNDDLTTTDQWQPTLAVTPTGDKLGIFYYSRQEDPTGNNLFKYYGRIASISGSTLTFAPSFPISDTPSLPEFGRDGVVNPTYMGDYDTAYATIGFFHVSWSDSRSELSGGAGRKDPNVYYEAVDLGLTVLTTVPADDSVVSSIPLNYMVTFSDAIQVATVQATDLMVDGITASSFVVNTPTQVTFTFSSAPFSSQGLHVITMAAGAILRNPDGDTLAAYSGNFRYDATPLQVTTTVPSVNDLFILPSPLTYDVNFNEAIDPASLQTWDLVVSGIAGAVVSNVTVLPGNTTARFTLSGITAQGSLTATITAGSISDAFGNPGTAFSGTYSVDIVIASYPTPLIAKDPVGSLIYDPTVSGSITFAGDVDSFTLNVDANQTISVIVTPSFLLQPRIEIFDPNNVSQAVATAPASTIVTGIQASHANVGGVYTFAVTGANGSAGGYTLQVILNAAFEPEGKILGATDDTLASTKQTINISDAGSIRADGAHTAIPNFYFVGQSALPTTLESRNYATFSIPVTTPTILGAELRLANPGTGYVSPDPSETYTLFDVSATPAALDTPRSAGDATGIALFGDLGSGAVYGSRVVSAADNNKTVAITLNSAAVAALNAAIGSTISLGGAITTLAGSATQIMFGGASGVPSDVQLVLQTVNIVDTSFITLSTPQASALRGAVLGQTDLANYTAAAVPFVFEDISATGTLITTLTNQDNTAVTGPIGFTFPFFGVNNTTVSITSNGLLTFGGLNFSPINADLITQPTQASIAPFWDDLHTGGGVTGSNVFIQNLGSGANQHVTIQWNKIRFASGGTTGDTITFEAQLYADGRIQFNYQDLASGTAAGNEGASATVGVKPASGTQNLTRLLLAFNNGPNTFVGTGKSTLITPLTPTPDYYAFTLNAGDTATLAVGGAAALELRDASDAVLATGSGAANLASVISNFAVPTGGTYYARITGINGAISAPYSFVITRNAAFDTEDNSSAATAQPFGTQGALGALFAQTTINAVDFGWIQADGTHIATNSNYTVGLGFLSPTTSTEFRNYSTFTLPAGTANIIGAELRLFNPGPPTIPFPGYNSPDPTETYTLFDVSATPAQLDTTRVSGDSTGIAIHGDLADGTIYGTRVVSAADNNTMVGISLNADAVAALNAAVGSTISFGGAITTLEGTAQQTVFLFSGAPGSVQLVLKTVPDDWYSITLPGTVNALRLETSTPGDGPGEPVNTLNPKIELYDSDGTTLIASGVAGSDGRNESIVALGLTPGATYKVRVTNDNSTTGEYFLTRSFEFSPVVTSLNVASPINENDTATLNGTFTDLDSLDTHTVIIHWGTGGSTTLTLAAGVLSFSATHQYLDDNPTGTLADISTIAVTVTDNQFGSGSASVDVRVNNVAPDVAAVSGPSSGVRGQTLTFSGAFSDVGSLDIHEVRWDFGDGNVIDFHPTTDTNALTASHVYAASGVYTLTLSIRDDDGGLTSVNKTVAITAVAIQTDPCDSGKTALVVGGTTDNDTIVLNPQSNGDIGVLINGASQGTFRPTGHIVVYGQDGDDDIQIASSIALDAWLYGDAGNDRLKGGAGSSILLGGDGDDQVNGGSGRSILIGGRGNDRLVGGSGDDILIAGFILNDRNALFLCVLQDTWKSTDGYAVRITRLRLLLNGLVVIDDNCIDMLTGASGLDWYFLGLTDVITGNQNGESVG